MGIIRDKIGQCNFLDNTGSDRRERQLGVAEHYGVLKKWLAYMAIKKTNLLGISLLLFLFSFKFQYQFIHHIPCPWVPFIQFSLLRCYFSSNERILFIISLFLNEFHTAKYTFLLFQLFSKQVKNRSTFDPHCLTFQRKYWPLYSS